MAETSFKKFKLTYIIKSTNKRVTEEPRLMITTDGNHKSLFINENTVLATVPIDHSDAELWNKARASLNIPVVAQ
jgi:hypothetical protein